jgi:chromosome segregation ATPase
MKKSILVAAVFVLSGVTQFDSAEAGISKAAPAAQKAAPAQKAAAAQKAAPAPEQQSPTVDNEFTKCFSELGRKIGDLGNQKKICADTFQDVYGKLLSTQVRHQELGEIHAKTQQDLGDLKTQHQELGKAHAKAQQDLGDLRTQNRDLEDNHKSLQAAHSELQYQHTKTQEDFQRLEQDHAELSSDHEDLKGALAFTEAQVAQADDERRKAVDEQKRHHDELMRNKDEAHAKALKAKEDELRMLLSGLNKILLDMKTEAEIKDRRPNITVLTGLIKRAIPELKKISDDVDQIEAGL